MLNFKIIKPAIQTVFILTVIWGIYFIAASAYNKLDNNNLNFIPETSDLVIQIDTKTLLSKSVTGVIKNEDNDFIQLLHDLSSEDGGMRTSKPNGIELSSDVILFKLNDEDLIGALFNLRNAESFKNSFSENKNIVIETKGNVGILLHSIEQENKTSINTRRYLDGPFLDLNFQSAEESIVIWTRNENKFNRATLEIFDSLVKIDGEVANQLELSPSINPLFIDGFHTTISNIPENFNDSIKNRFGDTIPAISGISLNYFGTELIEEPEFLVAPKGDFLIEFKDSVYLPAITDYLLSTLLIDSINANKHYYGPKPYYAHQISDRLVYFGIHDYKTLKHSNSSPLIHLSGDLTQLTLIDGGGFFKRIMEIIPAYGASKMFASKVEYFDLRLIEKDTETSIIEGEIKMKDEASASVEFLRFL